MNLIEQEMLEDGYSLAPVGRDTENRIGALAAIGANAKRRAGMTFVPTWAAMLSPAEIRQRKPDGSPKPGVPRGVRLRPGVGCVEVYSDESGTIGRIKKLRDGRWSWRHTYGVGRGHTKSRAAAVRAVLAPRIAATPPVDDNTAIVLPEGITLQAVYPSALNLQDENVVGGRSTDNCTVIQQHRQPIGYFFKNTRGRDYPWSWNTIPTSVDASSDGVAGSTKTRTEAFNTALRAAEQRVEDIKKYNLPLHVVLVREHTVSGLIRAIKVHRTDNNSLVGWFFPESTVRGTPAPIPWRWHCYFDGRSGHGENENECIYQILKPLPAVTASVSAAPAPAAPEPKREAARVAEQTISKIIELAMTHSFEDWELALAIAAMAFGVIGGATNFVHRSMPYDQTKAAP
jgi:hypothetical protein